MIPHVIRTLTAKFPAVLPHLSDKARWLAARPEAYKTEAYFRQQVERLVTSVYDGYIGGEFVYLMGELIYGQTLQAFTTAWKDEGMEGPLPDYLLEAQDALYNQQFTFVEDFYRAIVDARVDQTPIEPLLARAPLWANQYNTAYSEAVRLITAEMGGKLIWVEGDTVDKCDTCVRLDGIVAFASEWEQLHVHPQGAPNELLECQGFRCHCKLEPTDKRRSPKAFETIMDIVSK